jgi:hypothetical protein
MCRRGPVQRHGDAVTALDWVALAAWFVFWAIIAVVVTYGIVALYYED